MRRGVGGGWTGWISLEEPEGGRETLAGSLQGCLGEAAQGEVACRGL